MKPDSVVCTVYKGSKYLYLDNCSPEKSRAYVLDLCFRSSLNWLVPVRFKMFSNSARDTHLSKKKESPPLQTAGEDAVYTGQVSWRIGTVHFPRCRAGKHWSEQSRRLRAGQTGGPGSYTGTPTVSSSCSRGRPRWENSLWMLTKIDISIERTGRDVSTPPFCVQCECSIVFKKLVIYLCTAGHHIFEVIQHIFLQDEAFDIGEEMADVITRQNPKPIKLKFEKVCIVRQVGTRYRYIR